MIADPITARKLPLDERGDFLPRHTGRHMIFFENIVYSLMERASRTYGGGIWEFFELSNGGFYMAPNRGGPMTLEWPDNYFEGSMTPDAAGIGITLMALSLLGFQDQLDDADRESVSAKFHQLREFALDHKEAGQIFRLID